MALTNKQWIRGVFGEWVVVLAISGCAGPGSEPQGTHEGPRFSAVRDDSLVAAGAAVRTLAVGADCSAAGRHACKTELAVHLKPMPNEGWTCTRRCESPGDCLPQWECVAVGALGERLCVPRRRPRPIGSAKDGGAP